MLWLPNLRISIISGVLLALASGCNSTLQSQAGSFQSALDSGMNAAIGAQTATTEADWNLVANHWQKAIDQLEAIPSNDENAGNARDKIVEYQQNMAIAQQRAQEAAADASQATQQPPLNASPTSENPSTTPSTNPSAAVVRSSEYCQTVTPTSSSQPLEVSNLRFYTPEPDSFDFDNSGDYIIGCLTNHSNQAVRTVNATYSYGSMNITATYGFGTSGQIGGGLGSLKFPGEAIAPNQTVPFRSSFSIDQEIPEVEISTILSDAVEVPLSLKISR